MDNLNEYTGENDVDEDGDVIPVFEEETQEEDE